jgi:hypothetical protein
VFDVRVDVLLTLFLITSFDRTSMIGHVRENMCISRSNMVVWNWTVTEYFGAYYGFSHSFVASLGINKCMCYYHQVTNNGDLISFEVASFILNIMS